MIAASPVVMVIVGMPFSHFWTVQSSEREITEQFKTAMTASLDMFADYDSYSEERLNRLKSSMDFSIRDERLVNNRVDELSLYLKSSTAKSIDEAKKWIDGVDNDLSILGIISLDNISTWNIFLLGNISTIEAAINQWAKSLDSISRKTISSETESVAFSTANASKEKALSGLENLKHIYQERKAPNALAITTLLICYLMLLCPYFVQERNAANCERFWDFGPLSVLFDSKNNSDANEKSTEENHNNNASKTGKGAPV